MRTCLEALREPCSRQNTFFLPSFPLHVLVTHRTSSVLTLHEENLVIVGDSQQLAQILLSLHGQKKGKAVGGVICSEQLLH